jgi:hypothetical protein
MNADKTRLDEARDQQVLLDANKLLVVGTEAAFAR